MTEQQLLCDCLRRLNECDIPYMLVGSMAGNYWGIPRSTHDIDFVIEYETDDVGKLVAAFSDEFFIQEMSVKAALKPPHQFNALDNRSALKIDFFRLAGDAYEFERFKRRKPITLFGEDAWIACAEDIILHKLRWYTITPSDRQLSDAGGILAVSGEFINHDYLTHWAAEIGVAELLGRVQTASDEGTV